MIGAGLYRNLKGGSELILSQDFVKTVVVHQGLGKPAAMPTIIQLRRYNTSHSDLYSRGKSSSKTPVQVSLQSCLGCEVQRPFPPDVL